ncbi:MAG: GAF domain-containing sensor histidine kinase [Deltaproteobacteria bacterium]|nr:GAF domain-containing sensor histidine kinase [Deltaproteobacteria bacterium]
MPASNDRGAAALNTERALLQRIEEMSFLGAVNERLAHVPDFASACRALVELVWEERYADAAAFVAVDAPRRICTVQTVVPASFDVEPTAEMRVDREPFATALAGTDPIVIRDVPPLPWMPEPPSGAALIVAPLPVRGNAIGVLLVHTRGDAAALEDHRRVLALVATSAALALDAARNEAREEFLATLRHDINNPVHVALGYMEMLADRLKHEGCSPEMLGLASSVTESLKAVADLATNHLHMAAIDRGIAGIARDRLDFGALAGEIVGRHRPTASEKNITLVHEGGSGVVRGDRRQLGRVVTNLVGNALKYTPAGGRIEVEIESTPAAVRLRVRDTGYGVAAADLERLFTKYGRFHRDRAIPGTGLGLYLSKAIVEAHGGTVTAASEVGRGSEFTVSLPRTAA